MKKILLLVAALAGALVGRAQFDKPFGQMVKGIVLGKDGTIKKLEIKLEHPDFMKRNERALMTSEGALPKPALQAFSYYGRPWEFQKSPIGEMWVVHDIQGVINRYVYVTTDSEGKNDDAIVTSEYYTKGDQQLLNTELLFSYKKKMSAWVSDYPELAAKVETGYGAGLPQKVIDEYNTWYEKNNPGKLKYLPREFGLPIPGIEEKKEEAPKGGFSLKGMIKQSQADNQEAVAKSQDAQFAGRSATPAAEFASAKDNVPVKKETFAAKMQRIKADGNKIGVVFVLRRVHVNSPDYKGNNFETPVPIEGEITETSLEGAGKELIDELNAALHTTDIEMIDMINVPYRETKVFGVTARVDDWWASKYKLVFAYTIDLEIRAVRTNIDKDVFNGRLMVKPSMIVSEYIGPQGSNKWDIQANVMNMGYFESPAIEQAENITDIGILYNLLIPKLKTPLPEMVKTMRVEGVNRLVKKVAD